MNTEQKQLNALKNLCAKLEAYDIQVSHYDLGKAIESLGLVVEPDSENNELSLIKLPGTWNPDGSDIVVGKIVGDAEARIT